MKSKWFLLSPLFLITTLVSPGLALDGDAVPASSFLQTAVVSIGIGKHCTGVALDGGIVLTAAHCLVVGPIPLQELDHTDKWRARPVVPAPEVSVEYYMSGRIVRKSGEDDSVLVNARRDIGLLKVAGGHPPGVTSFPIPIGWRYAERFDLINKPTVLIAGRGSHGDGSRSFSDLRWFQGEASGNLFAPGGMFIESAPQHGACRGDSGGPVFLQTGSGLPNDPGKLMVVGVMSQTWKSRDYGAADYVDEHGVPTRHCSSTIIAYSLFPGADDLDAGKWLVKTLGNWGSLPSGQDASPSTDAMDGLLDDFLNNSERITGSVYRAP